MPHAFIATSRSDDRKKNGLITSRMSNAVINDQSIGRNNGSPNSIMRTEIFPLLHMMW